MYRKSRAVALFLLSLLTVGSLTFGQAFAAGEDSRFDALKRFSQVLDIVERYYVKETPRPDLVNGALKGMLESLDPHSTMLSKEEFKDMQESTSGEFFGIGIEITMENNQLTVVTPIEDTPADKGGMKSGDIILAVGGKPTLEMTLQEAVSHIRGPKGSEVVLTILHRDSKERLFNVQNALHDFQRHGLDVNSPASLSPATTGSASPASANAPRRNCSTPCPTPSARAPSRASSSTCATTPAGCWIRPSASPTLS